MAELRARRLSLQETRREEAAELFRRGQEAEAAGKTGAAKVFYQMAARRATGELKTQVASRLQTLSGENDVSKVASNRP